jgi:hypothetical protein
VATTSEPWLLLPMVYAKNTKGVFAEYNHNSASKGVQDFIESLPGKEATYYHLLSEFITGLYQSHCIDGEKYFLDKTPRYSLIANELIKIFPNAKFIILWRNPLSILSSRFHSYGNKWRIYNYKVDLYKGLEQLLSFQEEHHDKVCRVNYEQFVESPEIELARVMEYLDLPSEADDGVDIDAKIVAGRMGDKTGINHYSEVSKDPLNKWKKTVCNPLRKYWFLTYIRWIGADRFAAMGYDYNEVILNLNGHSVGLDHFLSDICRYIYGKLDEIFDMTVTRKKLSSNKNKKQLVTLR